MGRARIYRRRAAGFSLLELLLALGLGLGVCALMLQSVMAEGQNGQRLARLLRERQVASRALTLLRSDLQRATEVASSAGPGGQAAACKLAGRAVLLHLQTAEGPITYSVGRPAEPIWRGQVLMRCGPAFGLDGSPSTGQALNRVVLDGLAVGGSVALQQGPGTLRVELRQQLPLPGQPSQLLTHERLLPMP
ncbi:MAG: hypothetical protein RLZZ336_1093 [Cyanobacteriota bacterium]